MAALVELRNVQFRYAGSDDGAPALAGVDLVVQPGQLLAVVGANGSGKSTLARLMNALLLPSDGEVRVEGHSTRDAAHRRFIRQTVGLVFQNPENQLVAPTVAEEVGFGPANLGLPQEEVQARVARSLEAVGLSGREGEAVHRLSGGEKQRLALAGVLALEPRCLVLDEATSMLDPVGRAQVMTIVQGLCREGVAAVLVTHAMEEAAAADRVVVLHKGRVEADGLPRQVFGLGDRLVGWGLTPPAGAALAVELRGAGLPVPEGILAAGELVEVLCRSW